jgi:NTE family protein
MTSCHSSAGKKWPLPAFPATHYTSPNRSAIFTKTMRAFIGLLILVAVCGTALAESPSAPEAKRPRIALVLSGGGARGLAHVGVLQVLEEMKVPVDCVVGTSMGALVGGTFAAGVGPAKMREALGKTDINSLFDDSPLRSEIPQNLKRDDTKPLFDFTLGYNNGQVQLPVGAAAGYKFELFLKQLVGPGASIASIDFDKLPTPYRAVATDLETGNMRVFDSGDLPKVMRASMSLPAIVAPTLIDGSLYVDGGLVRNLPVDIGRQLCGDIVIAVNLGTPLLKRDKLRSVLDIAGQSINLMAEQNVQRSLAELTDDDILIEPDLNGISSTDFANKEEIIARGIGAANLKAALLARLAVAPAAYDTWLAERKQREMAPVEIARIKVVVSEGFNASAVERDLKVKPGKEFDSKTIDEDVARMYGRADFSYLSYSIYPEADGATAIIDAETKPWGPGYLRVGLGALSDFSGPTQLNVAASYRRTWANSLGAEWRVDAQVGYDSLLAAEFLQPLQLRDGLFVAPYVEWRRRFVQFYSDDLRLGQYQVVTNTGGIDVGLSSSFGELRLGPYIASVRTRPDFGVITPVIPEEEFTLSGVRALAVADHLDRPKFARSGWFASADVRSDYKDSEENGKNLHAVVSWRSVESFGKNSVGALLEIGETPDGNLATYDVFQLGGPLRLSGLFIDQLTGTRYNLATLAYFRQYGSLPSALGRGLYFGTSLEAGRINDSLMQNPWGWTYSSSVFWAADTIMGAVYLGVGYSSLGQGSAYLMIGPRF